VAKNVAYGLERQAVVLAWIQPRVHELLVTLVGLPTKVTSTHRNCSVVSVVLRVPAVRLLI